MYSEPQNPSMRDLEMLTATRYTVESHLSFPLTATPWAASTSPPSMATTPMPSPASYPLPCAPPASTRSRTRLILLPPR